MHWVSKLLAIAATGALGTNAMEASIFKSTMGQDKDLGSSTVSEDFARLALKLRVESSVASVLGTEETELDRLDQFVDTQFSLFGGKHDAPGKTLIILEGLDEKIGLSMRQKHTPNLFVPRASEELLDDSSMSLGGEDEESIWMYQESASKTKSEGLQVAKEALSKNPVLSACQELFRDNVLDAIQSAETRMSKDQGTVISRLSFKSGSAENSLDTKLFESIFQDLMNNSPSENQQLTVVLLSGSRNETKAPKKLAQREVKAYRDISQSTPRALDGSLQHSNLAPVCHVSNSSCTESTNSCSGHGHCYLKYGSGSEGAAGNCYACRCQETVVRKSDGSIQKIQWGGPACQKKDISSPFFLIASVTVFAILAVGTAIGMLFSMGSQELPSVIGAGVGAPKVQS
ncbi:hypothetical protein N7528_002745 [Penicillium herquei]|nr:hypothetical protein N7528_002745 [Penicillium herquei]